MRPPSYPRRQTFFLTMGAVAAASLGGAIGWVAKWARPPERTVIAGRSAGPDHASSLVPALRPRSSFDQPQPPTPTPVNVGPVALPLSDPSAPLAAPSAERPTSKTIAARRRSAR